MKIIYIISFLIVLNISVSNAMIQSISKNSPKELKAINKMEIKIEKGGLVMIDQYLKKKHKQSHYPYLVQFKCKSPKECEIINLEVLGKPVSKK